MSYTEWLRRQTSRLEDEIREHTVFDSDHPATSQQLDDLRRKVVIHTYLRQQLLRRDTIVALEMPFDEEYETQEYVLVRKA